MKSSLNDSFGDVKAKNSSEEALQRWRSLCGFVKKGKRGFCFTANLSKSLEAEAIRRSIQEKVRVAVLASRAALQFINDLNLANEYTVPEEVKAAGFQICPDELGSIVEGHDIKKSTIHDGTKGIAEKLSTSISNGINRFTEVHGFWLRSRNGFWLFVWEALQDVTLMILAVCPLVLLVVGMEEWPKGSHDGLGIVASILLVMFVSATSNCKQSLHFKDLDMEKQKIVVQVAGNGFMQKISIDHLLPGDTVTVAAMKMEEPVDFTCMVRSFRDMNDDSLAVRDCNSHRSGEFPTASSESRRLLLVCVSENSDDLRRQLVADLESCSIDEQKQAAMEIRLLAKNKPENRIKITKAGAIKPLISLISSSDLQLQEYAVTAILNLSLCRELIDLSGAIKPLVRALKTGTSSAKENATCALLHLSQIEGNKIAIGRLGGIPHLVNLLENERFRGKKDALGALCSLCALKENKIKAVQAGIMKPLVELMRDFGSELVEKSAYTVGLLISLMEAKTSLVETGGIPVVVKLIEGGSELGEEIAVAILLQLCEESVEYRTMVAREGAITTLAAVSVRHKYRQAKGIKRSFLGREEFFKLKCCSFNPKDLEKHFKKAHARFYILKGVDDPNLKQAYLNQLPEPLGNETLRFLKFQGRTLAQTTLGDLYQLVLNQLQLLCNKSKFLINVDRLGKSLGKTCDRPDLRIKCSYSDKTCDCRTTKKRHHRRYNPKYRRKPQSFKPRRSRRRFFRIKKSFKKNDRCFICKKKGHFSKECPLAKKKKIIQ